MLVDLIKNYVIAEPLGTATALTICANNHHLEVLYSKTIYKGNSS